MYAFNNEKEDWHLYLFNLLVLNGTNVDKILFESFIQK